MNAAMERDNAIRGGHYFEAEKIVVEESQKTRRTPSTPIRVWRYRDAPKELQFSTNGGDEDWLALVPPALIQAPIGWLEADSFGCCSVDEYSILENGDVTCRFDDKSLARVPEKYAGYLVVIGCHA